MKYLVDSDWIIDALAGRDPALQLLSTHATDGLCISMVTVGEVYEGLIGAPNEPVLVAAAHGFLQRFAWMPVSEPVMRTFAEQRAALRRKGILIPDFDLVIAATAIRHDLILMTKNARHFGRLPRLRRLMH